jgi:hypothetical protein
MSRRGADRSVDDEHASGESPARIDGKAGRGYGNAGRDDPLAARLACDEGRCPILENVVFAHVFPAPVIGMATSCGSPAACRTAGCVSFSGGFQRV